MFCKCDAPMPEADTVSCLKCGHAAVAAIPVDALDTELQRRRRNGYRLETTHEKVAHLLGVPKEQIDGIATERPEDCSDENCWRHGGKGSCRCDDETEGGVWQPGC